MCNLLVLMLGVFNQGNANSFLLCFERKKIISIGLLSLSFKCASLNFNCNDCVNLLIFIFNEKKLNKRMKLIMIVSLQPDKVIN